MHLYYGRSFSCCRAAPDKHDVGFSNVLVGVSAEEQVTATASQHDFRQAWFIYGQSVAVPCLDPAVVDVNYHDFDLRAFQSYLRHRWTTDIAGANAYNLHVDCAV